MNVLLISTYELGHQPLAVARPAAHLAQAGHDVRCLDLAVEHLDEQAVRDADLVGISVPMHTATRLGIRLAARIRALNPRTHVCFYGLYAGLHADVLLDGPAESVIGGEFETPLVELAGALEQGRAPAVGGVRTARFDGSTFLGRQALLMPRRDLLPPLERYARVVIGDGERVVGYVEASRGCAHRCLHCPITPVYGGRLRIVDADVVLDDVRRLVGLGARHITFGDPDFFNGIRHSLRIVEAMHAAWPDLTFDATIKVEHLIEHRVHLETLRRLGCIFVVSAFESIHDHVLANLRKGHSAADLDLALGLTRDAGLPIRPTFVPFTPWTSLEHYVELLEFILDRGLLGHVEPIQLAIRLLVPRGSSLAGTPAMAPFLGPFDAAGLSYRWVHPDPRMDQLQADVARMVERGARQGQSDAETFSAVLELAYRAAGRAGAASPAPRAPASAVPRLTEPWFC